MRVLVNDRADLIEALVAETDLGGVTAALLEKDEHLTDALRAVFSLKFECVELVFCGGTSLSKAHGLIERMSEDADIRVVLTNEGLELSRTQFKRYLRDEVRTGIAQALAEIGFIEDADQAVVFNEYRYIHTQWTYGRKYPASTGLRPNLQLELTVGAPALPLNRKALRALADRFAGRPGSPFVVPTLSAAETMSEKVMSFLRRFAQHRSRQMQRSWDSALVRHIYDVHCIVSHDAGFVDLGTSAFAGLVKNEKSEFGKQQPDFAEDPLRVLEVALSQVGTDDRTRSEYELNLLPLVYGTFKPSFDDAFESFRNVASTLIAAARAAEALTAPASRQGKDHESRTSSVGDAAGECDSELQQRGVRQARE